MFENRALKRIFGPMRKEVREGWRKEHNEEIRDLYSSPIIISDRVNEMDGACSMHDRHEKSMRIFVGKPGEKRSFGRPDVDGRIMLEWILRK
jgi:hypothetical protein